MKYRLLAAGALSAMVALTACGSSSTAAAPAKSAAPTTAPVVASGAGIKTVSTGIGTVLTNSQGMTLYWFAPDTATKSNCNGTCATFWPPVKGPVTAASGVSLPGKFGTITRADGSVQATYDGHPLYTYKADTAPGQTTGNGLKASGGLWVAMTPAGTKPVVAAKPTPAASSSSGGGAYGY